MKSNQTNELAGSVGSGLSPARAYENFAESPEILSSVIALFRQSYPADLQALRLAAESAQTSQVAFLAHRLKGSLGYFNADKAVEIAIEIESCAANRKLQDMPRLINHLEQEVLNVDSVLQQLEAELGDPDAAYRGSSVESEE
jgi:HPt (histidine-containing phosphotransfer) domain-containing protein